MRLAVDRLEAAGEPRVGFEHVTGALRQELDGRFRAFEDVGDAHRGLAEVERFGGQERDRDR